MSGTQPMAELAVKTVVNLVDGLSKTPRLRFAWGAPSDPISVGLRGHWAILADGLLDLHAYLGFDGKQLLIAPAAANAVVRVNGRTLVGHAWCPVAAPGEIELGGARLKVELDGPALDMGLPVGPNSTFDTLFDGGVLRQRGQALSDAPMVPATPPHVAFGAPGAQTMASGLADQGPAKLAAAAVGRPHAAKSSVPPTSATSEAPPVKKGFWASASVPKKLSVALLPLAVAATWYSMEQQPEVSPPTRPVHAASSAKAVPRAISEGESVASVSVPRLARTAASPTSVASQSAIVPEVTAPTASSAPSASGASAAPAPSSAPTPSGSPAVAPTPDPSAARTVAPPGYSERAALDAAFLGNLKEAARIYGKLADANAGNRAFKLAARLAEENAVRRP